MIYHIKPSEEEKIIRSLQKELHSAYRQLDDCQQRMFLIFLLGFLTGLGVAWLIFSNVWLAIH